SFIVDADVQHYIQAVLASGARSERVGPFLAKFEQHNDNRFLNYAVPDDDCRPSVAQVEALIVAFHAHQRIPRLEYVPSCAPV
ncbi:MAG: GNAT family N-acetyltransferase, partial [Sciscionella sp.]